MPVRGRGWYKRPYKLRITVDPDKVSEYVREQYMAQPTRTYSFHWKGSRDKTAEQYRFLGYVTEVEVWDEPVDATVRRDA